MPTKTTTKKQAKTCRETLNLARGDRTWRQFAEAIREAAGLRRLSHQAVYSWYVAGKVPADRVKAVASAAQDFEPPYSALNPSFA